MLGQAESIMQSAKIVAGFLNMVGMDSPLMFKARSLGAEEKLLCLTTLAEGRTYSNQYLNSGG
jgi:hypothetical protein